MERVMIDREHAAREMALLVELAAGLDPVLATLGVAIYLEEATELVLSDEQIESGLIFGGGLDQLLWDSGADA